MSIRDDNKFMELLKECMRMAYVYHFEHLTPDAERPREELIDYIDEYVSLQLNLEEFPAGSNIAFEEGLQKLPEWQKEINQRTEKALEVKND